MVDRPLDEYPVLVSLHVLSAVSGHFYVCDILIPQKPQSVHFSRRSCDRTLLTSVASHFNATKLPSSALKYYVALIIDFPRLDDIVPIFRNFKAYHKVKGRNLFCYCDLLIELTTSFRFFGILRLKVKGRTNPFHKCVLLFANRTHLGTLWIRINSTCDFFELWV